MRLNSATKPLNNTHVHEGGTFITNFGNDKLKTYIKALSDFGDDRLVISDVAVDCSGRLILDCCSLHSQDKEFPENMSTFWTLIEVHTQK